MASISILASKIPIRSLRCVLLLPLACRSVLLVGAESVANAPNSDCIQSFSTLLKTSMASISILASKIPIRSLSCVLLLPLACRSVLLVGAESGEHAKQRVPLSLSLSLLSPPVPKLHVANRRGRRERMSEAFLHRIVRLFCLHFTVGDPPTHS